MPVAAATSVLIVIVTVVSASFTHIFTLINHGGIDAASWHLVVYTIPGVTIGCQIGPRLRDTIPSHSMERAVGLVFAAIGTSMLITVHQDVLL